MFCSGASSIRITLSEVQGNSESLGKYTKHKCTLKYGLKPTKHNSPAPVSCLLPLVFSISYFIFCMLSCHLNSPVLSSVLYPQGGQNKEKHWPNEVSPYPCSSPFLPPHPPLLLAVLSQRSSSNKVKNDDSRESLCNIWKEVSTEKCPSLRL